MPSIFSGLDPISGSSSSSLSSQDKEKLNKLKTDGEGTKFLNDKMEYVEVSGNADIDDSIPASDKVYSSQKVEDEFAKKSDIDVDNIKKEVEDSVKTDFFSKQETKDYIDNKLDTKVDKVSGMGLSKNSFEDNYKNILDNLETSKFVIDENYVHTDNNLTNELKDKILATTGGTSYVGLFEDLNERDSYSKPLVSGYWCAINNDTSHENKKTKYYYNGTEWIFDGYYSDTSITLDDSAISGSDVSWSVDKLTNEYNKKANQSDVNASISEINTKLDKKLEVNNLKSGQNIDIDVDSLGNLTINSTASGGTSTGGTTDYELLSNKPKINGITAIGDKTAKDLKLLDSSYASTENEGSVKMADKAKEIDIEGQLDGTAKYYGVGNGGTSDDNTLKLRPFPVGTATERIDTLTFDILTKDVPQSIPFAREIPDVNCFVQAFKQEEAETNANGVFEDYSNENVSNHSENVVCGGNGLSIKGEYEINNNGINSDGLYKIKIGDFINIKSIKAEVNE